MGTWQWPSLLHPPQAWHRAQGPHLQSCKWHINTTVVGACAMALQHNCTVATTTCRDQASGAQPATRPCGVHCRQKTKLGLPFSMMVFPSILSYPAVSANHTSTKKRKKWSSPLGNMVTTMKRPQRLTCAVTLRGGSLPRSCCPCCRALGAVACEIQGGLVGAPGAGRHTPWRHLEVPRSNSCSNNSNHQAQRNQVYNCDSQSTRELLSSTVDSSVVRSCMCFRV